MGSAVDFSSGSTRLASFNAYKKGRGSFVFFKSLLFSDLIFHAFICAYSWKHRLKTDKISEISQDDIFPQKNGQLRPLKGKIVDGRYFAPQDLFCCQADTFGEKTYLAQDLLLDQFACVGFYHPIGDFKKAEIVFLPPIKKLDEQALKNAFQGFGIGILEEVDRAEGIRVLKEEMLGDMFFAAISIDKMAVLKTSDNQHQSSTRGYLVFHIRDKLVILSNQIVNLVGQKHDPKKDVENIQKEILEFSKTFDFGIIR